MITVSPAYKSDRFTCPHCTTTSQQSWLTKLEGYSSQTGYVESFRGVEVSYCLYCDKPTLWVEQTVVYPLTPVVPNASEYMPSHILQIYREAASVHALSPRASAALLRLAVEETLKELGEASDKININIQRLVDKGLDQHVQQALDYCRLVGNNAIHPGKIALDDSSEIAFALFTLVNLIVDETIGRRAKVAQAMSLLPQNLQQKVNSRTVKAD